MNDGADIRLDVFRLTDVSAVASLVVRTNRSGNLLCVIWATTSDLSVSAQRFPSSVDCHPHPPLWVSSNALVKVSNQFVIFATFDGERRSLVALLLPPPSLLLPPLTLDASFVVLTTNSFAVIYCDRWIFMLANCKNVYKLRLPASASRTLKSLTILQLHRFFFEALQKIVCFNAI
jgi:hypothetical protein